VIVVLDGQNLEWQSDLQGLTVIRNSENMGKVKSTLKAIAVANSDLILSVDSDTILSPNSLEQMVRNLEGDVEVVCARIEPLNQTTWIDRTRSDLYKKWHARPRLINGACFLARRETLEDCYPKLQTMVEDQELTRILSNPSKRWTICQEAVAKTEEPKNLPNLFHQLVRWAYGAQHLRSLKERRYRATLGMMLFVLVYADIPAFFSGLLRLDGGIILVSLIGPLLLTAVYSVTLTWNYYTPGVSLPRVVWYSLLETSAFVVGGTRFVVGRPPDW